ncbi:hypothetical protein HY477_01930 [Candidatus Uhrbacteria bacterium]|nr:hypothetical protein [Candidatus Uhrbacteria bacterium]
MQDRFALFRKGTRDSLLNAVGVPYGWLMIEEVSRVNVGHLAQAKSLLRSGIDQEILTADQAGKLEAEMVAAGLPDDEMALYRAVADFKVPDDFKPAHTFKVCTDADCPKPKAVSHGVVTDKDGNSVTANIQTLEAGFASCRAVVRAGEVHALDAVAVFKAMVAANLPVNPTDVKARVAALPEDERRKYADKSGGVGTLEVMVVEMVTGPGAEAPDDQGGGFFGSLFGGLRRRQPDPSKGSRRK